MTLKIYKAYDKPLKIKYEAGKGGAEQSHKSACDINRILKKYQKTGALDHQTKHEARYDDMTGTDFHTALNMVANAQNMFNELPSSVRKRMDNDPGKFLEFIQDPNNKAEAIKMGLMDDTDNWSAPPSRIDTTGMEPESTSDDHGGTIETTK
jgi:phage internal scaffolding protein